jgi:hypothetical protein
MDRSDAYAMAMRVKSALQFVVATVWAIRVFLRHPDFWRGGISIDEKIFDLLVTTFTGLFVLAALEFLFRAVLGPRLSKDKDHELHD